MRNFLVPYLCRYFLLEVFLDDLVRLPEEEEKADEKHPNADRPLHGSHTLLRVRRFTFYCAYFFFHSFFIGKILELLLHASHNSDGEVTGFHSPPSPPSKVPQTYSAFKRAGPGERERRRRGGLPMSHHRLYFACGVSVLHVGLREGEGLFFGWLDGWSARVIRYPPPSPPHSPLLSSFSHPLLAALPIPAGGPRNLGPAETWKTDFGSSREFAPPLSTPLLKYLGKVQTLLLSNFLLPVHLLQ